MIVSKKMSVLLLLPATSPAQRAKPNAAERMIRRPGRDRVRLPAAGLDVRERLLPARPKADVEPSRAEPHVRAQHPGEQDIADLVVDAVRPVDPVPPARARSARPSTRSDCRHLPRVVRLNSADRDERVTALSERVGGEILELAHLVAAVGEARVTVVPLCPDLDCAAKMLTQPPQWMHRRVTEQQGDAVELDAHLPRVVPNEQLPQRLGSPGRTGDIRERQLRSPRAQTRRRRGKAQSFPRPLTGLRAGKRGAAIPALPFT